MAGSITISSSQITGPSGSKVIGPLFISATNPVLAVSDQSFSATQFNAIPVPGGTTAVVIVPPTANLVGLTLKGVTGDVGIALGTNLPACIPLASTVITIGLASAAAIVGVVEVSFI
jgi:hypothetical protein